MESCEGSRFRTRLRELKAPSEGKERFQTARASGNGKKQNLEKVNLITLTRRRDKEMRTAVSLARIIPENTPAHA